jgi:hypothetical protein
VNTLNATNPALTESQRQLVADVFYVASGYDRDLLALEQRHDADPRDVSLTDLRLQESHLLCLLAVPAMRWALSLDDAALEAMDGWWDGHGAGDLLRRLFEEAEIADSFVVVIAP